jgi:hypothetical protein
MADEAFLERTYEARDRYVTSLGTADPNVLAPLINPSFMGGPMWPDLRQAWRVIRRKKTTLVISDGLSDPFSDEEAPNVGYGLEVLAETDDALPKQLQGTWLFNLVYRVSQQCAAHGGVRDLIDELGLISLELPVSAELMPVATENRTAGVLLGLPAPDYQCEFTLPAGQVKVVTAKLLWPSELAYAAEEGEEARAELARRFAADGSHHRSSLKRKPAV